MFKRDWEGDSITFTDDLEAVSFTLVCILTDESSMVMEDPVGDSELECIMDGGDSILLKHCLKTASFFIKDDVESSSFSSEDDLARGIFGLGDDLAGVLQKDLICDSFLLKEDVSDNF